MKRVPFSGRPPSAATPAGADAWVADRQAAPAAEPTRRFTFDVPVALHRRIRLRCIDQDRPMADVLRDLLEREFPPV